MERSSCFKHSLLFKTKRFLLKLKSSSRDKNKGNRNEHGLASLCKDMELHGEYADIQFMWKMIHGANVQTKSTRSVMNQWRSCFNGKFSRREIAEDASQEFEL